MKRISLGRPQGTAFVYKDGNTFPTGAVDVIDQSISPATVFNVASASTQFTAMSVLLLARQGKLHLDDDIRKYLPELPAYQSTVTIRQLIHHTSGVRDRIDLMAIAGRDAEEM
jgi:CubicO group peptidase (beta-lactamase class C family)